MPTLVDGCEEVVETGGESPEEDKEDKETQNEETASGNKSNIQSIVPTKVYHCMDQVSPDNQRERRYLRRILPLFPLILGGSKVDIDLIY